MPEEIEKEKTIHKIMIGIVMVLYYFCAILCVLAIFLTNILSFLIHRKKRYLLKNKEKFYIYI